MLLTRCQGNTLTMENKMVSPIVDMFFDSVQLFNVEHKPISETQNDKFIEALTFVITRYHEHKKLNPESSSPDNAGDSLLGAMELFDIGALSVESVQLGDTKDTTVKYILMPDGDDMTIAFCGERFFATTADTLVPAFVAVSKKIRSCC